MGKKRNLFLLVVIMLVLMLSFVQGDQYDGRQLTESRNALCEETWECARWSECFDGVETRRCRDLNECGTDKFKPIAERECQVACEERWQCDSWSGCIDGKQTRVCNDINNCGTEIRKPLVENSCRIGERTTAVDTRNIRTVTLP